MELIEPMKVDAVQVFSMGRTEKFLFMRGFMMYLETEALFFIVFYFYFWATCIYYGIAVGDVQELYSLGLDSFLNFR